MEVFVHEVNSEMEDNQVRPIKISEEELEYYYKLWEEDRF